MTFSWDSLDNLDMSPCLWSEEIRNDLTYTVPSWKLTYPPPKTLLKMVFLFPKVGYVIVPGSSVVLSNHVFGPQNAQLFPGNWKLGSP